MNKNEIGCIFVKQGNYGEYLSIKVDINGVTHNLTAFLSKYYEEGGKKPKYYIPAPKIESNQSSQVNSYQSRIDFVNAEKAKLSQAKASDPSASYNQEPTFSELDVPF